MQTQRELTAYEVVHTTPERIRIYIPKFSYDPDYTSRLQFLVASLADVSGTRINERACSLIVSYGSSTQSYDIRVSSLRVLIQQANDTSLVVTAPEKEATESEFETEENPFNRLILPTLGLGLAISLVSFGVPIPPLMIVGITLISAIPVITNAVNKVANGQADTEILNAVWTVFHTLEGEYIAPNLDMTIAGGAEVLRDATGHTTLPAAKTRLPLEIVRVERENKELIISVNELSCGDILILYPGDINPIDGKILAGEGLVDQSILTGEETPIVYTPGEKLMAFSLILEGKLRVSVDKLPKDTEYMQESRLGEGAPRQQTLIGEYAAELGKSIILPTLIISGTTYLLTANVNQALSFLKLDLATGISISAPTAVLSSMTRAKQMGIYIHSGHGLEMFTEIDVVVFSKTGTLTQGSLRVFEVELFDDNATETEMIRFAASVKEGFKHPVARAITRYAQSKGIELLPSQNWKHRRDLELGVSAQIDSHQVLVGSSSYLRDHGIYAAEFPSDKEIGALETEAQGIWRVYVAVDGELLGRISCCDDIRPESRDVVASLHNRGLEVHMVTSNNHEVANNVANWVGIPLEFVHAETTPQDKVELLQALQASGKKVAFVGEGMDDYAAMCYADIAVGTNRSCPLVAETSEVLLPYGNLLSLLVVFDIATETVNIIQQNIAIIAVPNIGVVMLGVVFALDPIFAVILNSSVNILAELNALRPLLDFGMGSREVER